MALVQHSETRACNNALFYHAQCVFPRKSVSLCETAHHCAMRQKPATQSEHRRQRAAKNEIGDVGAFSFHKLP